MPGVAGFRRRKRFVNRQAGEPVGHKADLLVREESGSIFPDLWLH